MRALLVALDRWFTDGVEPPSSRFPTISDRALVAADRKTFGLPAIPGLRYQGQINHLHVADYDAQPPTEGAAYTLFVPAVDDDGNDIAGIRLPAVEVPVATCLGWNLRRAGYAEGALCGVTGSSIAFPRDREEAWQRVIHGCRSRRAMRAAKTMPAGWQKPPTDCYNRACCYQKMSSA
jgi:hypothetical protein